MCNTSLFSIKDPVFSAEAKKGIKKPRHLFKRLGQISRGSAIISQIPNEYPNQPQTSRAESKYNIEDQSASATLSVTFTHAVRPFS